MAIDSVVRRLPTTDVRRIKLRDAKMWRRETERALRTGQSRSRCPCTLCLFGKPLLRRTHAIHLREFGRHPKKRLQPQAISGVLFLSCTVEDAKKQHVLCGPLPLDNECLFSSLQACDVGHDPIRCSDRDVIWEGVLHVTS